MIKLTVVFVVVGVLIALCSAYPAYPAPDYNEYGGGNGYENNDYNAKSFEPPYAPRFGSGFDESVYGSYSGHPGPYDSYGQNEGGYGQQQQPSYPQPQQHTPYAASYGPY